MVDLFCASPLNYCNWYYMWMAIIEQYSRVIIKLDKYIWWWLRWWSASEYTIFHIYSSAPFTSPTYIHKFNVNITLALLLSNNFISSSSFAPPSMALRLLIVIATLHATRFDNVYIFFLLWLWAFSFVENKWTLLSNSSFSYALILVFDLDM